ncbi:hypothetical protein CTheo_7654 [Ceratobasidium theobromae]|uniref:NACHT domain-containing protein n=1 Tax=Ceratobasidium theobromae TaxID=1582974 RepID=A0A5N5QB84_9AGAM|nr:hypothetical protein CTheo_7654 [Ceratobasidium theobromae]
MTTPVSPKPKRGVRGFLREKYDSLKSHIRYPSQQQFLDVSSSRANSKSPAPSEHLSSATVIGEAPLSTGQPGATLRRINSLPTLVVDHSGFGLHTAGQAPTSSGSGTDGSTRKPTNANIVDITAPELTVTSSEKTRNLAWAGFGSALRGLHKTSRLFPPLQAAIGALISCLDTWELAMKNRECYEDLAQELTALSNSLAQHIGESRSFRMSNCIANVAWSIEEQVKSLQKNQSQGIGRDLVRASSDEGDLMKYYRKIEYLFRRLQTDANLSTWGIANEHLANTRLEALTPSKLALYDSSLSMEVSRRTCTEGTRTAILSGLNDWSCDPNAKDIYLMSGMAGTGKTAIACSLSERLEERKQLAASFFCTRTSPECRQVQRIIPTIAYQLARYSIPFQVALCEILGNDPDVGSKNIRKQFERLLKEPLMAVKDALPDNLVVVIDALDECEDRNGVELLLDLLFQLAGEIPVRFFVTSRPEPEIYMKMVSQVSGSRKVLHLHEIEKSLVRADIALYLKEELGRFMSPTQDQVDRLSQRSGSLFIYAATLVRHVRLGVRRGDHQKRLDSLLITTSYSAKQYAQLDGLYTTVLKSALNGEDLDQEAEDTRAILWTVICAQEPVDIETLAALARLDDPERARSALQPLRSVLHISENSKLVSTLHASFPDFMFNEERSGSFFCDATVHSQALVRQCFITMRNQLRFNICNIGTSFAFDRDVGDLPDRIAKHILPPLSYACRHWADHLRLCKYLEELCSVLEEFLLNRLLFWMEVLNLKGVMAIGMEALPNVIQWLQISGASSEVIRLAEDARMLVMMFTANPISQSTPHIYTSLLPFSPKSNSVSEHYQKRTRGLIEATGSGMDRRDAAALASWKSESPIKMVAYSPDGTRVAFGCKDGTIGIRSAHDGSMIFGPIGAHNGDVWDVAFSPCGAQVASCGGDHAIRLWDARNGLPIAITFEGHSGPVLSISFAPNGGRIASGSNDRTIRVWDINNGVSLAGPFEGHTDEVRAVAFSPDGARIVSGSADHTIRVWSSTDSTTIVGPFIGHTDWVRSVAFSPDGSRIVSGSDDRTIRVWAADSGVLVNNPLEGHGDWVLSVAFSPDGARIVSGSNDSTICVWNAFSDTPTFSFFEGHTNSVVAAKFSPDGTRIISGSIDHTIRTWSTFAPTHISSPPEGHINWVLSVAFSPDGACIASGSYDTVIRFWDARTGIPILKPLRGHTDVVRSVAFSPDGTLIASGSDDHTVRVWNLHDETLAAKQFDGHTNWVVSVAFSPDGTRVVSGSFDHTIRVWGISDGNLIAGPLSGHSEPITCVMFSPDGTHIVSGSHDSTVQVWDVVGSAPVAYSFKGHTEAVYSIAFSPDGIFIASGSGDRTIQLWKAHDGTPATSPLQGHTGPVNSLAFSPDGMKVVSGSTDRTIRLWNSSDGTSIGGPFEGHVDDIWSVAFSPDGAFVASGSSDWNVRVWDVRPFPPSSSSRGNITLSPDLPASQFSRASPFGHWSIKEGGWITDGSEQLLFWLPQEALRSLITPHCSLVIGRSGTIEVDLSAALLGNRWQECYITN